MKMPGSVGTKKAKAVEQLLEELGVGEYMYDNCVSSFFAEYCDGWVTLLNDKELIANFTKTLPLRLDLKIRLIIKGELRIC